MSGPSGVVSVEALSEMLRAPVCTSYLHNDAFSRSHPNWMGPLGYQVSFAIDTAISKLVNRTSFFSLDRAPRLP